MAHATSGSLPMNASIEKPNPIPSELKLWQRIRLIIWYRIAGVFQQTVTPSAVQILLRGQFEIFFPWPCYSLSLEPLGHMQQNLPVVQGRIIADILPSSLISCGRSRSTLSQSQILVSCPCVQLITNGVRSSIILFHSLFPIGTPLIGSAMSSPIVRISFECHSRPLVRWVRGGLLTFLSDVICRGSLEHLLNPSTRLFTLDASTPAR